MSGGMKSSAVLSLNRVELPQNDLNEPFNQIQAQVEPSLSSTWLNSNAFFNELELG